MSLDVIQKVRYRYQQTEPGAAVVANSVRRAAARIGLADWFNAMRVPVTDMLTWIRKHWPDVMLRLLETFSGAPLVSSIADRYFARYGSVYSMRPSEQVRGLFERWSHRMPLQKTRSRKSPRVKTMSVCRARQRSNVPFGLMQRSPNVQRRKSWNSLYAQPGSRVSVGSDADCS
jgi:hypothetical protein